MDIDDIVIYKRPLSPREVIQLHKAGTSIRGICEQNNATTDMPPATCRDRIAQYTFDEGLLDDAVSSPLT